MDNDCDLSIDEELDCSETDPEPEQWGERIIAYYPEWGVYERDYRVWDIAAEKITHINYGFVTPNKELCTDGVDNDYSDGYQIELIDCEDPDCASHVNCGGTLQDTDIPYVCSIFDAWAAVDMPSSDPNWPDGSFAQLQHLKTIHPHLKTLISIGGWTLSGQFSDMALTASSRETFVSSCVQLMEEYGFDGIDVDWEYPVSGGLYNGAPEDKENYTLLLAEFRSQLDAINSNYLLTIAAPAGEATIENMDLDGMIQHLDWINLMSYDLNGSWSNESNFQSALYDPTNTPTPGMSIDNAVSIYLASGVPSDKLVLGFPFYGRGFGGINSGTDGLFQPFNGVPMGTWEAGVFDYHDLVDNYA